MKEKNFLKNLESNPRVFLDTMCFVYFFESNKKFTNLCEMVFKYIALSNKTAGHSSIIVYTEILTGPKKTKNIRLEKLYREIFRNFPHLKIIEYDWMTAEIAAELKTKYNLELPDAINVASAVSYGNDLFITNDRKLAQIKEIPVLVLKDYI